jgi:DcmR-like sensory protein
MDSSIYYDSGREEGNKWAQEEQISDSLVRVPIGHHYLILYSSLDMMRKVYSKYVKGQIENAPNSVILLLPYYDSTDKVREVLDSMGINVKENERRGALIIVDIENVITNPYFKGPDIERLRCFTKELENKYNDKTIFVIADMSVFHHVKKASELLEYERTLHKDLKVEKWKELCFYNERDFDIMFTKEQTEELLGYHKDRVITI